MKTQINELKKGVNRTERDLIAKQVILESGEIMVIKIRGFVMKLKKNVSLSGKTTTFTGAIPIGLYKSFCGDIGIIEKDPKTFMQINSDMTVMFFTNSKKRMWQNIEEKEVEICEGDKIFSLQIREIGEVLDQFSTYEAALKQKESFEEEDKQDGHCTENFYEIKEV